MDRKGDSKQRLRPSLPTAKSENNRISPNEWRNSRNGATAG